MKILFIVHYNLAEYLGIGYLSAILKKHGYTVDILRIQNYDSNKNTNNISKYNINIDYLIRDVYYRNPDVLAYSVTTGEHNLMLEINEKLRNSGYLKKKIYSVFGGAHCTYFPEIIKNKYVDIVFQGECEETIVDVFRNINKNVGKVIKPKFSDLDKLPLPDREIMYKDIPKEKIIYKTIMTSRGCPYACPYCYNSVYKKEFGSTKLRFRAIDSVIEEGKQIKEEYPETKMIFFNDDEFAVNGNRLLELMTKWKKEVGLSYHCQIRIDKFDNVKAFILKRTGCISATFAIETGNVKRRNLKLKRKMTDLQIISGANILRNRGIKFRTENMLGLPYETIDKSLETLDINIKCKPTIGWASLYQPYNKTPCGEECTERGIFDGNLESLPKSFFEKTVLECFNKKQKKELQNLQRLFSLIVWFPILRPFVKLLIKVPNNKFYDWVYVKVKNKLYNRLYEVKNE
jgi:radical SAM superfamily enzyme YgiQ (UPF0313 family)